MNLEKYTIEAHNFANYRESTYPWFLLIEEIGEFMGKIAKQQRGDYKFSEDLRILILKELGDVCWAISEISTKRCFKLNLYREREDNIDIIYDRLLYYSLVLFTSRNDDSKTVEEYANTLLNCVWNLARIYDSSLSEIMQMNIDKLTDRKNRNVIKGDGDNR